jgi:hypothetical protein
MAKLGIDIVLISRTKAKLEAVAAEIGMNSCYLTAISYQSESQRRNMGCANIWDLNWISTDAVRINFVYFRFI